MRQILVVKKIVSVAVLGVILFSSFLISCKHEPPVIAVPQDTTAICDTQVVTYAKDIQPIFKTNCYRCHSTDSVKANGGGLDLEDTTSLKAYLKNGFRGDGIYGSKLYHCMLHSQNILPMPPAYICDTCSLNKVLRWTHLGAPLN